MLSKMLFIMVVFSILFAILFEISFEFQKCCVWIIWSFHHLFHLRGYFVHDTTFMESIFIWIENKAIKNGVLSENNNIQSVNVIDLNDFNINNNNISLQKIFKEKTKDLRYPIIIRGLYNNETSAAIKKWKNPQYLNKYLSNETTEIINFEEIDGIHLRICDGFGLFTKGSKHKWSNKCNKTIQFKDFVLNKTRKFKEPFTFFADQLCNDKYQDLFNDLEIKKIINKKIIWNNFHPSYITMHVGYNTYGTYHFAPTPNVNLQISGHKKWIFIDPKYSIYMRQIIGYGSSMMGGLSDIIPAYEINKYKHHKLIPKYIVTVEPGDITFVPPFWWHHVESLNDEWAVGVGMRDHNVMELKHYLNSNWLVFLHGLIEMGYYKLFGLKHDLDNLKECNFTQN